MRSPLVSALAAAAAILLPACAKKPAATPVDRAAVAESAKASLGVLPEQMPGAEADTPELVSLGRMLYFEKRLSATGTQACNDCHHVDGDKPFGVDGEPTSAGARGARGARNAPTVKNAGYHVAQFWDGRAATLEEQAQGPILNPVEMAMPNAAAVEEALRRAPEYTTPFATAFPGQKAPMTLANAARAIAAFERTLRTHDRLDDFLRGNLAALSDREVEGLHLFLSTGCATCHSTATLGANQYQILGLVNPYETKDPGRYAVTHLEEDRRRFKVPSLRNVGNTGPWFHDGSVASLPEAVRRMAWYQLGRKLTDEDVAEIVAFLHALADRSGPVPAPSHPASS